MDIKELYYENTEFNNSKLILNITGEHAVYQILNSLRRACISYIPIYCYHPSKIKIFKNTSIYDNTELKLRFSNLPINNIKSSVKYLSDEYLNDKFNKHDDDDKEIEIYVKQKNNTIETIYVTTEDAIIKVNNELIKNETMYSKKNPILLVKLLPDNEIEFSAKSVLSNGNYNGIFNASNCYYKQKEETNEYEYIIESSGQMLEYEIIIKSCEILIEKFITIEKNFINDQYTKTNYGDKIMYEIYGENNTTFGPINYFLQNNENIKYSGLSNTSYLQKKIHLIIKVKNENENENINKYISESINDCIKTFNDIKKKVSLIFKKL